MFQQISTTNFVRAFFLSFPFCCLKWPELAVLAFQRAKMVGRKRGLRDFFPFFVFAGICPYHRQQNRYSPQVILRELIMPFWITYAFFVPAFFVKEFPRFDRLISG